MESIDGQSRIRRARAPSYALVFFMLATGCNGQPQRSQTNTAKQSAVPQPRAYATAETGSDGTIQVRDASSNEIAGVDALQEKMESINNRYPAPDPPLNTAHLKAVRVEAPGLIYFKDARTVRIDGIRCSKQGIEFISKKVLDPKASVVILPSIPNSGNPQPAVVWVAYHDSDKELGSIDMVSAIADAALMNHWCEAEYSRTSKYNDRYAALAKMLPAAK